MSLTPRLAGELARLPLNGIGREWPHSYQHLALGPDDVRPPRALHPAFYGCFDWHSAVHSHWALVRILRRFPRHPLAARIRSALGENLTRANLARELEYFLAPGRSTFERPYGWAWLLALASELRTWRDRDGRRWASNLRPLEDFIAGRFCSYLPKQRYPVRTGLHSNTAFALGLALDYARAVSHRRLATVIRARSRDYYGKDSAASGSWEPSGADFLSPVLVEADLMRRVMPAREFRPWMDRFLPGLAAGEPRAVLTPPRVLDRRDPLQVHLDGLSLSRAWALRRLAGSLPRDDPAREVLIRASGRHSAAGLARVASGDYAGEHWLASFAVYLLCTRSAQG